MISSVVPSQNLVGAVNPHEGLHTTNSFDVPNPRSAVLAAVVPALASVVGSIINTAVTNSANRRNIAQQNYYNSPIKQRGRLEAAGLNPYLMYGDSASAGNQSSPAVSQAADFSALSQIAPILAQQPLQDAEIKKIEQDIHASQTAEKLTEQQTIGQNLANIWSQESMPLDLKIKATQILLNEASIANIQEDTRLKVTQQDLNKANVDLSKAQFDKLVSETDPYLLDEDNRREWFNKLRGFTEDELRTKIDISKEELRRLENFYEYEERKAKAEADSAEYQASMDYYERDMLYLDYLLRQYIADNKYDVYGADVANRANEASMRAINFSDNDFGDLYKLLLGNGGIGDIGASVLSAYLRRPKR